MAKRIGVRKEGSHWLVTRGGEGFQLEATKKRALAVAKRVRKERSY